ncbi:MAG TPA: RagB/SusD family nutrient uptake outer membrane protein [Flavisolibacter sp.]|jgi:hypothetical protein|nr:RagB/SusD family nutrient uptake outer membrane protein [Flavisolibacter sp.]
MKFTRIYTGLLLMGAVAFTNCKKVIDIEPEFVKDGSKIFTTLGEYEFALTGAYALTRQTGYFGSGGQTTSSWANLPDMMGDDLVQTAEDLGNWTPQVNWVYSSEEGDIGVAWQAAYSVVGEANLVLRNIEQFSTANAQQVNRIKGQALAIRAMAHFDVLRYWGVDFDRNSTSLGIPYVTAVDIELKPSRLTVKETWDNIFKDLLEAETLLGDVDKAVNGATRTSFDRTAVRGLLARAYLYAKEYGKADQYATTVITALPLASRTAFPALWNSTSQSEVVLEVAFSNPTEGNPSSGVHVASSNRNRFRPATPLTNLYNLDNDVRVPSYFASRATGNVTPPRPFLPFAGATANARKVVNKYITRGSTNDNVVNWKVMRTGEMYLIRAEARAMLGGANTVLALADLNDLRAARVSGYVPVVLAGQPLIDAIMEERRKELFAEGHRWFDLKRTTRTINRTDIAVTSTKTTLAPTAREWAWPIPQGEMDANPNMVQNPGY